MKDVIFFMVKVNIGDDREFLIMNEPYDIV